MSVSSKDVLIYLSHRDVGDWNAMMADLRSQKAIDLSDVERLCKSVDQKCITYIDVDFPPALRDIVYPPIVLYYEGDLTLLSSYPKYVSFAGSFNIDPETASTFRRITSKIASSKEVGIISGLAAGCQLNAVMAALDAGAKPIVFLPCGLDVYEKPEHVGIRQTLSQRGLVLTPFPKGTPVDPSRLRIRNRLIAQVSDFLLVGSSRKNEGVLEMVSYALNRGRDVGCLPFRVEDANYNNALLRDGAVLVESGEDVLYELQTASVF